MGLDIDVYGRVVRTTRPLYDEDEDYSVLYFQSEECSKEERQRAEALEGEMDREEALCHVKQWYRAEDCVKTLRAGSYTGYNEWVNQLAALAGYHPLFSHPTTGVTQSYPYSAAAWNGHQGPFHTLICHSDCDGILEAHHCAQLYKDFVTYLPVVEARVPPMSSWSLQDLLSPNEKERSIATEAHKCFFFLARYREWMEGCRIAARGGCLGFH